MGDIVTEANSVYRDNASPGSSVPHEPVKSEIRSLFGTVEGAVDQAVAVATAGIRMSPQTIRVRSTANVAIASGLENGDTLNGVVLATGDNVLLVAQTAAAENGVYTVPASGAAARASFADSAAELAFSGFRVSAGSVGAGDIWTLPLAADQITLGVTALAFAKVYEELGSVMVGANTAVGTDALSDNVSGTGNVAVGDEALRDTTVSRNTAVGTTALRATTTGSRNTAVGGGAARSNLTGGDNVFVGADAGISRTTGNQNVIVGSNAANNHSGGGDANTFVGYASATSATNKESVGVGAFTFGGLTTGERNIALGAYAGAGVTTGLYNICIGYAAGVSVGAVSNSIVIGLNLTTARSNVVMIGGADTDDFLLFGGVSMLKADDANNTYYFGPAGNINSTRQASIAIGKLALSQVASGGHCVAIGHEAMQAATNAGSVVAIGSYALRNAGTTGLLNDTVAIGFDAFAAATSGVGGVAVGHFAGQHMTAIGNNTCIGDSALRFTDGGIGNVGVGYVAMDRNTTGSFNVAIGQGAGIYRATGDDNIHIGYEANGGLEVASPGGFTGGNRNVGIGKYSLRVHTGSDVVAVGHNAGMSLTTASNSTFLGANAGDNGSQKVDAANSMALGANTHTTKDNQVVIGDASVDEFVLGGVTVTRAQLIALLALL